MSHLFFSFVIYTWFQTSKLILTFDVLQSNLENGGKSMYAYNLHFILWYVNIFETLIAFHAYKTANANSFFAFSYHAPFSPASAWLVLCLSVNLIRQFDSFFSPTKLVCYSCENLSAYLDIEYPMVFELRNSSAEIVTHCGVLEFTADEGIIHMPEWVCD